MKIYSIVILLMNENVNNGENMKKMKMILLVLNQ